MIQRRGDRRDGGVRRGEVRVQRGHAQRRVAGEAHVLVQPAERDQPVPVRAVAPERPGRAQRRHGQHDHAGVDLAQVLVAQPPAVHPVAGEVVGHHVAARDQLLGQLDAARVAEVEGDRALAGVAVVEHAVGVEAARLGRLDPDGPDVVQPGARLDLDHVGAVVGQHPGRRRPGDQPAEVGHADALQQPPRRDRGRAVRRGWPGAGGPARPGPPRCAPRAAAPAAGPGPGWR